MKKIKSIIAILLVCALFLSVASCGKDSTDETTTTTTEQYIAPNETFNPDATYSDTVADSSVETTAATPDATNGSVTPAETQAPANQGDGGSAQQEPQANTPENNEPQQTQAATPPTSTSNQETHEADGRTYYVYYPENIKSSKKTYPVLSWANGTACQPSMYTGLFTALAKGGYIVIASSETMSADGNAQIAALDFVISLNNNSSSLAYKKVNTKQLGVIGHSQGGRSSVNAAVKDSRIKCVVSIAGSNYLEEAEPNSTPTFFIAGGKDMIVSPSQWIQPAYDVAKGPAVYASLNGALHTGCCTNPEKYSSYILDWCNAWLKGDLKALATFSNNGTLASDGNWSNFQCKGF
jgi:hypothetical protein